MLACSRRSESAQGAAQNERRDVIMLFQKSQLWIMQFWLSFHLVPRVSVTGHYTNVSGNVLKKKKRGRVLHQGFQTPRNR